MNTKPIFYFFLAVVVLGALWSIRGRAQDKAESLTIGPQTETVVQEKDADSLENAGDPADEAADDEKNHYQITAWPSAANGPVSRLTLTDCLNLALKARDSEWKYHREIYGGSVVQTATSFVPHIQVEEQMGPLPDPGWSGVGFASKLFVKAGIPVYDFGRAHNYHEAALGRLQVEGKVTEQQANQDMVEIVQLYYGILLAQESLQILYDSRGKLDEYLSDLEEKQKKKKSSVNKADVLNMRYESVNLAKRINEMEDQLANAFMALAVRIGYDGMNNFSIQERFLRPLPVQIGKVDDYQELAKASRPEFAMFQEGLKARKALISAEQKAFLPVAFFGGFLQQMYTNARPQNDVVWNHQNGGVGAELSWNFDWTQTQGKVKSARAEYYKLAEQQRLALPAIQLDVSRAYRSAVRTQEDVERGKEARKIGRALLFIAKSNWDVGVGDAVKMKDALIRFNEARFNHLKSIFDFNVAVAKLSQAVGGKALTSGEGERRWQRNEWRTEQGLGYKDETSLSVFV